MSAGLHFIVFDFWEGIPVRKRDKVLETFMPGGKVKAWPAKFSKQLVILRELVKDFAPATEYKEPDLNDIIAERYEDYCLVRRLFVDLGFMERREGVYRLLPEENWLLLP